MPVLCVADECVEPSPPVHSDKARNAALYIFVPLSAQTPLRHIFFRHFFVAGAALCVGPFKKLYRSRTCPWRTSEAGCGLRWLGTMSTYARGATGVFQLSFAWDLCQSLCQGTISNIRFAILPFLLNQREYHVVSQRCVLSWQPASIRLVSALE